MFAVIPIVISTISLIVSLVLAFRAWWIERFNLDFEFIKWFGCNGGGHPIFLWLYITNYSKLPCSVLEIKVYNERGGQVMEGSGIGNKKLISTIKSDGKDPKEIYSLDYPVKIEPYNSIGGYFHVFSKYGFHNYEEDVIKIIIRTTRGTIMKNVFMDRGKNIYRVWQHKDPSINIKIDKRSDGSIINYLEDTL
jgi:hypothetical protein